MECLKGEGKKIKGKGGKGRERRRKRGRRGGLRNGLEMMFFDGVKFMRLEGEVCAGSCDEGGGGRDGGGKGREMGGVMGGTVEIAFE